MRFTPAPAICRALHRLELFTLPVATLPVATVLVAATLVTAGAAQANTIQLASDLQEIPGAGPALSSGSRVHLPAWPVVPKAHQAATVPVTAENLVDDPVTVGTKAAPKRRREMAKAVARLARKYKVDPRLVMAIAQIESGFRSDVVSSQQAVGLMQLTPDTAARFGVKNSKDWRQNLRGGMAYLRWLLAYFRGDVTLAVAAYNSGEGNVSKYMGVPPFPETMRYVQKLRTIYHHDWHPYDKSIKHISPAVAGSPQPPDDLPVALN